MELPKLISTGIRCLTLKLHENILVTRGFHREDTAQLSPGSADQRTVDMVKSNSSRLTPFQLLTGEDNIFTARPGKDVLRDLRPVIWA